MVAAMLAVMVVVGPAESMLLNPLGWAGLRAHPEIRALVMAANMTVTVAMAAWTRFRGRGWVAIAELAAAMLRPPRRVHRPPPRGAAVERVHPHHLHPRDRRHDPRPCGRREAVRAGYPDRHARFDGKGRLGGDDATPHPR
jgi:hypothetical protein